MPFPLSVMLWTVFRDLPFEERVEKIAEAGYDNIELVGEYNKWDDTQFRSAVALRRRLGIHFDATAGSAAWRGRSFCPRCLSERAARIAETHGRAGLPGDDRAVRQCGGGALPR